MQLSSIWLRRRGMILLCSWAHVGTYRPPYSRVVLKIRPRGARKIVQCCMLLLAAFLCGSVARPERIRFRAPSSFLKVGFEHPHFRYEGSNHLFHAFFQGFFGLLRRKGRGPAMSLAARIHLLASKCVCFGLPCNSFEFQSNFAPALFHCSQEDSSYCRERNRNFPSFCET